MAEPRFYTPLMGVRFSQGLRMIDTNQITIDAEGFTSYLQTVYNEYYSKFSPQEWTDIINMASDYVDLYEAEQESIAQYDYGYEEGLEAGRDAGYDDGYEQGHDEGYAEGVRDGREEILDEIRDLAEDA